MQYTFADWVAWCVGTLILLLVLLNLMTDDSFFFKGYGATVGMQLSITFRRHAHASARAQLRMPDRLPEAEALLRSLTSDFDTIRASLSEARESDIPGFFESVPRALVFMGMLQLGESVIIQIFLDAADVYILGSHAQNRGCLRNWCSAAIAQTDHIVSGPLKGSPVLRPRYLPSGA